MELLPLELSKESIEKKINLLYTAELADCSITEEGIREVYIIRIYTYYLFFIEHKFL